MYKLDEKNVHEIVNLTPQQLGMLTIYLRDRDDIVNLIQGVLELTGLVDQERVMRTFNAIIRKHTPLRSIFRWKGLKKPLQIVLKDYVPDSSFFDLTALHGTDKKECMEDIRRSDAEKQLDIEKGALRITMIQMEKERMVVLLTMHHIICDGWSTSVIVQEFLALYNHGEDLQEYLSTTDDYFIRYVRMLRDIDVLTHRAFWEKHLLMNEDSSIAVKNMAKTANEYGEYDTKFHKALLEKMNYFYSERRVTIASFLFYAWGKALSALANIDTLTFDITVSTRIDVERYEDINSFVGLFINTIPVLYRNGEDINTFHERVNESKEFCFLPVEGRRRSPDDLSILVVVENYPLEGLLQQEEGSIKLEDMQVHQIAGYDLTVIILPHDMGISIGYKTNVFTQAMVEALCQAFEMALIGTLDGQGNTLLSDSVKKPFQEAWLPLDKSMGRVYKDAHGAALHTDAEKMLGRIWSDLLHLDADKLNAASDFFMLGGDSLSLIKMISAVEDAFHVRLDIEKALQLTILSQLSSYLDKLDHDERVTINTAEKKERYLASSEQKRMYILHMLDQKTLNYNVTAVYLMEGGIDLQKIEISLVRLVKRHEALRTRFEEHDGNVYQVIIDNADICVEHENELGEDDLDRIVAEFVRPFNLNFDIPFRAKIKLLNGKRCAMILDMHHIACDGISSSILIQEFAAMYIGSDIPNAEYQYKDYSEWQTSNDYSRFIKEKKDYWINECKDGIHFPDLVFELHDDIEEHVGRQVFFTLDEKQVSRLNEFAGNHQVGMFSLLLSGFFILLYKINQLTDITVGIPVANRTISALSRIVGMFVNTLPFRMQLAEEEPYIRFLKRFAQKWDKAFANQEFQLDQLYDELNRAHGTIQSLFSTSFLMQNIDMPSLQLPDISIKEYKIKNNTAKFNLIFIVTEKQNALEFEVSYRPRFFDDRFIEYFISSYRQILDKITADADACIRDLVQGDHVLSVDDLTKSIE